VLIGGPDVWEVVRVVQSARSAETDLDAEAIIGLAAETMGLPSGRVRVALDYWAAYPRRDRAADPRRRRGRTSRRGAVAAGAAAAVVSVRLALDERFSPRIARELVRKGHDVLAVAADPGLTGLPDEQILEWGTEQGRCLVTENVKDYEALRHAFAAEGRTHAGLFYCGPRRFPATADSSAPSSSPWTS
jgi:Domain of unknown function (DUF5615)